MKIGNKRKRDCKRNGRQIGKSQLLKEVTLREAFSIVLSKTGINSRALP